MGFLILRVVLLVLSGLAGAIAGAWAGVDYDPVTQVLFIDIAKVSETLGILVTTLIGGGTFAISRIAKARGGVT